MLLLYISCALTPTIQEAEFDHISLNLSDGFQMSDTPQTQEGDPSLNPLHPYWLAKLPQLDDDMYTDADEASGPDIVLNGGRDETPDGASAEETHDDAEKHDDDVVICAAVRTAMTKVCTLFSSLTSSHCLYLCLLIALNYLFMLLTGSPWPFQRHLTRRASHCRPALRLHSRQLGTLSRW